MPRDPVTAALGILEEERRPRVTLDELARVVCPVPDPFASSAEAERWEHADVGRLSDFELWQESRRATFRLALEDKPSAWLGERVEHVRSERRRRMAKR
jgi:hypothetical protein